MNWRGGLRRLIPYLVASTAGFFTAYLIVFLVVFPSDLLPDEGKVPNVVGLLYDDAERQLFGSGYKTQVGDQIFHATSPKGTVLTQNPPGGTREQKGTTITLDISGGPRLARVPNVVGQPRQTATVAIENAGFDLGDVTERADNSAAGTVLSTDPAPGVNLTLPAAVSLVVSEGPSAVQIPDVVGRTLAVARTVLESAGLTAGEIEVDSLSESPGGTVLSQSPQAGASLAPGSRINLRVAGRTP